MKARPSPIRCLFASDLHGRLERYEKLFRVVAEERPDAVFLGGDLLPSGLMPEALAGPRPRHFVKDVLARGFEAARARDPGWRLRVFLILGNDDPRSEEAEVLDLASRHHWEYAHGRRLDLAGFPVYGYACTPPSPFLLKDWERYDVSRHLDPGAVSPEEGRRSVPEPESDVKWGTIEADLAALVGERSVANAVFLFHAPPYGSCLDRAALDGRTIEHVPLDLHVGSIAIRRFIERRQPLVTLHGHVHESARLTGSWRDRLGRTHCFSAAHDGKELALVRFDLASPEGATRQLI